MKATVTTCDVCGKPVSPIRSISLMAVLTTLRNGKDNVHSRDFQDICSDRCAHEALNLLIADAKW